MTERTIITKGLRILELEAEAAGLREQAKQLVLKARALEERAESERNEVLGAMHMHGLMEYENGKAKLVRQLGPPKIVLHPKFDEKRLEWEGAAIIGDYVRVKRELDRAKLLTLMAGGLSVAWAKVDRDMFLKVIPIEGTP